MGNLPKIKFTAGLGKHLKPPNLITSTAYDIHLHYTCNPAGTKHGYVLQIKQIIQNSTD